jgi:hypothetical protein
MHVSIKSQWLLEVSGQELTLIGKALTRTLKPNEHKAAFDLGVRLAEGRFKDAEDLRAVAEGAWEVVKSLTPENES